MATGFSKTSIRWVSQLSSWFSWIFDVLHEDRPTTFNWQTSLLLHRFGINPRLELCQWHHLYSTIAQLSANDLIVSQLTHSSPSECPWINTTLLVLTEMKIAMNHESWVERKLLELSSEVLVLLYTAITPTELQKSAKYVVPKIVKWGLPPDLPKLPKIEIKIRCSRWNQLPRHVRAYVHRLYLYVDPPTLTMSAKLRMSSAKKWNRTGEIGDWACRRTISI